MSERVKLLTVDIGRLWKPVFGMLVNTEKKMWNVGQTVFLDNREKGLYNAKSRGDDGGPDSYQ